MQTMFGAPHVLPCDSLGWTGELEGFQATMQARRGRRNAYAKRVASYLSKITHGYTIPAYRNVCSWFWYLLSPSTCL